MGEQNLAVAEHNQMNIFQNIDTGGNIFNYLWTFT